MGYTFHISVHVCMLSFAYEICMYVPRLPSNVAHCTVVVNLTQKTGIRDDIFNIVMKEIENCLFKPSMSVSCLLCSHSFWFMELFASGLYALLPFVYAMHQDGTSNRIEKNF